MAAYTYNSITYSSKAEAARILGKAHGIKPRTIENRMQKGQDLLTDPAKGKRSTGWHRKTKEDWDRRHSLGDR